MVGGGKGGHSAGGLSRKKQAIGLIMVFVNFGSITNRCLT